MHGQLPILLVLITVICTSISQVLQKKAALELQHDNDTSPLFTNTSFLLSGVFLGASLICWLMVLQRMDVSIAYPLLSLNYVVVLIMANTFFAEKIPSHRWIGVVCIIAGVVLLAGGNA